MSNIQIMSIDGRRFTIACENCRLKAYLDKKKNGVWTIGNGHTKGVRPGDRITREQAMAFLAEDLAEAEAAVRRAIARHLQQHQFDMLVDVTFNSGPKFVNDPEVQTAIAGGDVKDVAALLLFWVSDDGVIEDGLLKRAAMRARIYMRGYVPMNLNWIAKHNI